MIDIEDVKILTLKPEQTLVVQTDMLYPKHLMEKLRNEFQAVFPNNRVIIIDKSLQLIVIDDEQTN